MTTTDSLPTTDLDTVTGGIARCAQLPQQPQQHPQQPQQRFCGTADPYARGGAYWNWFRQFQRVPQQTGGCWRRR